MHKLKVLTISIILAMALSLAGPSFEVSARPLAATSPGLGDAADFAILAGTPNITNVPTSTISGNVGLSPASGAGIGLTCAEVTGRIYSVDATGPLPCVVTNPALLTSAKNDLVTTYDDLSAGANAACNVDYGAVTQDLAGLSLVPGVYCADSFSLSGTLTLNDTAAGDTWIFRTASAAASLVTTPGIGARVQFLNNIASVCDVWWKVTSSATIGSGTTFIGNILALTSISLGTSATLTGRALARNGAVTLDQNTVDASKCVSAGALTAAVGLTKGFSPATITAGNVSTLTITFSNTDVAAATLTTAFTDNLPTGMVIAGTPNVATTCGGSPALTATAGGTAVTMATGGIIPAAGSCTLTVDVTSSLAGVYVNTVPAGALRTNGGNNTSPATATLTVTASPTTLPVTGFSPRRVTTLSAQPFNKAYSNLGDLWLEIPRLGVQMPIVGVPQTDGEWDVSWLGNQAGWLNGSAFPTWDGNSVITGHVYDASGNPGPFVHLNWLWWGDKVIVHAWGAQYVYEVRNVQQVSPTNAAAMMKHEELPWVTLVTCRGYDEASNSYKYRVLVRAVLVEVD